MSSPPTIDLEAVVDAFGSLNAVPIERRVVKKVSIPEPPPVEARGRSRERKPVHLTQYRSLSPRNRFDEAPQEGVDGNEHLQKVEPNAVLEMGVGATIKEWFALISELKRAEAEGQSSAEPASQVVVNTLKRFTNLPVDAILEALSTHLPGAFPDAELEPEMKYVETIFNRTQKAYLKVYSGPLGGKFIFTISGLRKYLSSEEKSNTVIKDPTKTTVVDHNPAVMKADKA